MPKSEVKGINGKAITGAMSQAQLISGGYNTLNEDDYAELLGLSSNLLSSSSEFDSCWNDCSISGAKDVTIEGIGEDARIFQWGMTFKNSNSIEVRNLTFEDYTEDACSFEGGSSNTSSSSADGFTYKNFWIHHNTFEEGVNYWDVCSEQDKHDGDGSTDIKRVSYVTVAYNIYHNTHKTGLVGSDNNIYTAAVTFHHNLYDTCKARLPLARQANMHMYNNYYKGTTSTDISLRGSAYALVENCYFEGGKAVNFDFPYDDKFNGANGNGWAKVIGCKFTDSNGNNINPKTSFGDSVPTSNFNLNVSRTAKLNTTNKYGADFDTDSSVFYYDSATKTSRVENMLTAEQVKTEVPKLAGVQKHTGTAGSGGSTGGDEHQHTYADTYTSAGASGHYKMATCGHSTEHTQLEPHVYDNATDTTCNECNYVRTIGGNELIKGDPSTLTEGALAAGSTQTFNGFKLYGSSKVTVTAGNNKITYNGKEYSATKYISLGGGADFSGNETCIEFTVTGNCKVTVASRSSGTAARTLKLVGGTEELTIDAPDKGAAIGVSTVSLSSGTYKIGSSSGGINVYYIIVEYLA
ncbi:MAG: hypothetical protein K2O67_05730 [Clostridia bacterium]|nr:hypothetical protein [Clostridia bacterium]